MLQGKRISKSSVKIMANTSRSVYQRRQNWGLHKTFCKTKPVFKDCCIHWKSLWKIGTLNCRDSYSLRVIWSSSLYHGTVTDDTTAHPSQKILKNRFSQQSLLQRQQHADSSHLYSGLTGCLPSTSEKAVIPSSLQLLLWYSQQAIRDLPNCTNSACEGLSLSCTSCTHREDDRVIHLCEQLNQGAEDTAARSTAASPCQGNAKPLSNAALCCQHPTRACSSATSAWQVCFCSAPCSGRVWDLGPEDRRVENT